LDAPRRVLTHATRNGTRSQKEMSRLFVAFLTSQYLESSREDEAEDPVARVIGCIKTEKSSDELVKELRVVAPPEI